MQELLLALIKEASGSFAFMAIGAFGCIGVAIIVGGVRSARSQNHSEQMAKIKAAHEETMFKIDRELPQTVGGLGKDKAIEHSRSSGD